MTLSERIIMRNGHPRRIIVGVITLIWMLYFLWFHNWMGTAVALIVGVPLSRIATPGMHEEQLAQTTFGKILLLHLHPANVILQSMGFAVLLCSVWIHSGLYITLGVSVILLGHMWGWHKVNQAL
jgi:hypothetical protein